MTDLQGGPKLMLVLAYDADDECSLIRKHMARAAWQKLRKWYATTDTQVLAVAAVMDPRIKLDFFRKYLRWPDEWLQHVENHVSLLLFVSDVVTWTNPSDKMFSTQGMTLREIDFQLVDSATIQSLKTNSPVVVVIGIFDDPLDLVS